MSDPLNSDHIDQSESEPPRSGRMLPFLLVILVLALAGGAYLWANYPPQSTSPGTDANHASAPQGDTRQALAALQQAVNDLQSARQRDEGQIADLQRQLSAEQGEGKQLSDQLSALSGRVDGLEKARAEYQGSPSKRGKRR